VLSSKGVVTAASLYCTWWRGQQRSNRVIVRGVGSGWRWALGASPANARREDAFRMCGCGRMHHRCRGTWSPISTSAEVFDEVLDRWLRLPCDLPIDRQLYDLRSALL